MSSDKWDEPRSLGEVLKRVVNGFGDRGAMYTLHQHWDLAVGQEIRDHCKPRRIVDGVLFVDVDHPGWATEIQYLERDLLAKLKAAHSDLTFSGIKVHVKAQ